MLIFEFIVLFILALVAGFGCTYLDHEIKAMTTNGTTIHKGWKIARTTCGALVIIFALWILRLALGAVFL